MTASDPLKLLVVIDSFGQGGAEHSLAAMLPRLADLGIEAHVVCRNSANSELAADLRAAGVPVTAAPNPSPLSATRWLRKHIRSVRPDVLHLNLFVPTMIGAVAAIGTDVPVAVSIVSTTAKSDPQIPRWKLRTVTALEGFVCRRACAVVHAVTDGVAEAVRRDMRVPQSRIHVAERGRSGDRFRPADRAERSATRASLGIDDDADVVIAVGRHVHQKGFDVLLRSIAALQTDRPGLVTLIPGRDGAVSEHLRREVSTLPRPEGVRLLGVRDDVEKLLRAADVFVLSSRREGAAGAALEAMATGLPIVATDLEGTADVFLHERNALVVPSDEPIELGAAIARLLDDRLLAQQLGTAARQQFSERFGLDDAVESLAAVYRVASDEPGASVRSVLFGRRSR